MNKGEVFEKLANRELTADEMGEIVLKDLKLLPVIFDGVSSENKRVKNATAKILRTVSYDHPEKLYPKFELFVSHMKGDDTILKWLAMDIIVNLSAIDNKNKVDKVLKIYYNYLSDESMVTVAHAVEGLGRIAKAKPAYRNEITRQLFRIKSIKRNAECRNILLGKCIRSVDGYFDKVDNTEEIIRFVKNEQSNSRPATAKKANAFLKKHGY